MKVDKKLFIDLGPLKKAKKTKDVYVNALGEKKGTKNVDYDTTSYDSNQAVYKIQVKGKRNKVEFETP